MYVTKEDYKAISKALELVKKETLTDKEQAVYLKAVSAMGGLDEKRKRDNARTWENIRHKRDTNVNYSRPKKEWVQGKRRSRSVMETGTV